MKNKFLTYLLLLIVIIVWGLIFVRLFGSNAEEKITQNKTELSSTIDTSILNSTYILRLNYTEPFLGQKHKVISKASAKKKVTEKVEIKQEPIEVEYLGMIVNKKQKSVLAMINWKGVEYYLTIGESLNGLELMKCTENYIVLKHGKTKYTITK